MKLRITVHGVAYEVEVEVLDAGEGFPALSSGPLPRLPQNNPSIPTANPLPSASNRSQSVNQNTGKTESPGGSVTSPIAGNVLEIKCKPGDIIQKDTIIIVIEAMKMETNVASPTSGTIKSVEVAVGDVVREGQILVKFL